MTRQEYLQIYRRENSQRIAIQTRAYREKLGKQWAAEYNKHYRTINQDSLNQKRSTPKARYQQQKDAAKRRNIEWLFTFETWWKIWEDSCKWGLRGRGGYMMCRTGDCGPYSPDNVRIDTAEGNVREMKGRV